MRDDIEKTSTSSLPVLPPIGIVGETVTMSQRAHSRAAKVTTPALGRRPARVMAEHLVLPTLPLELTDNFGMILPALPLKDTDMHNASSLSVDSSLATTCESILSCEDGLGCKPAHGAAKKHPTLERVSAYLVRERVPFRAIKPHLIHRPRPMPEQNILSLSFDIAIGPSSRWCNWATERFFDLNLLINSKVDFRYFLAHPYTAFSRYLQTTRLLVAMLKQVFKTKKRSISPLLSVIAPLPPSLFAAIFETQYQGLLKADHESNSSEGDYP